MMGSAAFVVANCYGVVGLLRLLALAAVAGVAIAAVSGVLPWGLGGLLPAVAPLAIGAFIAIAERRKRRRQRVVVVTVSDARR